MRRILNFFVTMLILFLASRWFPAHVQIDGFGALALTTLLLWLVGTLVALAFTGVMVIGAVFDSMAWIAVSVIGLLCSNVIAILILSALMTTFTVSGFWAALLLSLCMSLFTFSEPSRND